MPFQDKLSSFLAETMRQHVNGSTTFDDRLNLCSTIFSTLTKELFPTCDEKTFSFKILPKIIHTGFTELIHEEEKNKKNE